jgi:hypothetical protein
LIPLSAQIVVAYLIIEQIIFARNKIILQGLTETVRGEPSAGREWVAAKVYSQDRGEAKREAENPLRFKFCYVWDKETIHNPKTD